MTKSRRNTKHAGIVVAVQLLKTIDRTERRIVWADLAAPPVPEVTPEAISLRRENEATVLACLEALHDWPRHARAGFAHVLADYLLSIAEGGVPHLHLYLPGSKRRAK